MTTTSLRKLAEGREAEIFAWEDGSVLRLLRDPNRKLGLEQEAAAMRAAASAGVRVPIVREVITYEGRPGLVMERIDGVDMLAIVGKQPWQLFAIGALSGRIHAQMHEASAPAGIPALKDVFRRRITQSGRVPPELIDFALSVLDSLPDGDRLCHGDFHPGNIMRTESEPVIIDWTNASQGDSTADYVRTNLMIRMGGIPPGVSPVIKYGAVVARGLMRGSYVRAYRRVRPIDDALADRWETAVAANRLADGIEDERAKLIALLERRRAATA